MHWIAPVVAVLLAGGHPARQPVPDPPPTLDLSVPLSSTTDGRRAGRSTAGPDTFVLYGGPGTLEGKFETAGGAPDWQGWSGFDRSKPPVYWQVSTFNAENLGGHGPGNHAYWCGQTHEQASWWAHTPGYGSNWNAILFYESEPVSDPSQGQTVDLDFLFNHDLEPGYDYLRVEYENSWGWQLVYLTDSTNTELDANLDRYFPVPGVRFSDVALSPITYLGNDYAGPDGDRIRIRIRVVTDGAFDDQTGLFPTLGGAAQIDDLSISHGGGTFFEDFEGPGPWLIGPPPDPFAGDFSEIYPRLVDIDPWHENASPAMAFVDRGQEVRNGPGVDGSTSTGGETSPNWNYGIEGGYVVNHSGGLSAGPDAVPLSNEVWSPSIAWDLPGPDDDAPEIRGVLLQFDVFAHLPVDNALFYRWKIGPTNTQTYLSGTGSGYFSGEGPRWHRTSFDASENLRATPDSLIRISLGVEDFADAYPPLSGDDATPAPWFDNVRLLKVRLGGLKISARRQQLFRSSFPGYDTIDASSESSRDLLDVSFDTSSDAGYLILRTDEFIEDEVAAEVRVVFRLRKNPLFADAIRPVPTDPRYENLVTGPGEWSGEYVLTVDDSTYPSGTRFGRTWTFPRLLVGAVYPGDQFDYYVLATDNAGRTTTLPADLTGFGAFDGTYDAAFSVRGLPTITDAQGTQPPLLVYLASVPDRSGETRVRSALAQLGMVEGVDFDVYTCPAYRTSNGASLKATANQLSGYETILCFAGGGADYVIPEWTVFGSASWFGVHVGLDLPTRNALEAWMDLPGDRSLALFGAYTAFCLDTTGASGQAFLADRLGVQFVSTDVRPQIGGQATPDVLPVDPAFTEPFTVSGTDELFLALEEIQPVGSAVRGHSFDDGTGQAAAATTASVLNVKTIGADTKTTLTFPFAYRFVATGTARSPVALPARTRLLAEVLDVLGAAAPSGTPTAAPPVWRTSLRVSPNPFNPRTTIALTLDRDGPVRLGVYDLRGRRVRALHSGPLDAGPHQFVWDGRDSSGSRVASGTYLVRATVPSETLVRKVLMVK